MIVKNEAASIGATIASVRGVVDTIVILDTGSTDDTVALAREAAGATPIRIVGAPFVDFATTRNRAIEIAEHDADWVLMLSGDETLQDAENLRSTLYENDGQDCPSVYMITVHFGQMRYRSARLSRSGYHWRYVGKTHEVLESEDEEAGLPALLDAPTILHDVSRHTPADQQSKWERDLALLDQDARTAFYRAQTLQCLGRYAEARAAYQLRIGQAGWREEIYESKFRLAQCAAALSEPWANVQALYLEAYAFAPHRAEPLVSIAQHYFDAGDHHCAYLFAHRACALEYPSTDRLFVLDVDYALRRWDMLAVSAFYIGKLVDGRMAAEQALKHDPNDPRLKKNLEFYTRQR